MLTMIGSLGIGFQCNILCRVGVAEEGKQYECNEKDYMTS